MSRAKKQHYVPQSYLTRFTQDGSKLFAFDKISRKVYGPIGVENVAYSKYFYDIPEYAIPKHIKDLTIDPYLPEVELAKLEGIFNESFNSILSAIEGTETVDIKHLETMSTCLAIQLIRTPEYRRTLAEFIRKAYQVTAESLLTLNMHDWEKKFKVNVDYPEKSAAVLQIQHMWDPDLVSRLATTLFNHIWLFGITPPGLLLYTSDVPVIRIAHLPIRSLVNQDLAARSAITLGFETVLPGIAAPGVEIIYPLSSTCALMLFERTHFASVEDKHGHICRLTAEDVELFNMDQVLQCSRQVFCAKREFDQASDVCAAFPEACSPDRDRITIHDMSKDPANKEEDDIGLNSRDS